MIRSSSTTSVPEDQPGAGTESVFSALALGWDEAATVAVQLRDAGHKVVFTNGCFDLLHVGHVEYLQRARALGHWLFVGLNGDDSVRLLKGSGRPIFPVQERVTVLAALRPVDAVVVFHELTAEALVSVLRPDIYVKGGDWAAGERRPPEAAAVESYGGQVVFLPYLAGHSTSEAIAHIQRLPVDADDRRE